jgi:hypothetical protein
MWLTTLVLAWVTLADRPATFDPAGEWRQRLVACEKAGVKLVLRATKKFSLSIETRCQNAGDRMSLSGSWSAPTTDSLLLRFPADEGPDEELVCRVETCEPAGSASERCIRCDAGDVSFQVRREPRSPSK